MRFSQSELDNLTHVTNRRILIPLRKEDGSIEFKCVSSSKIQQESFEEMLKFNEEYKMKY